MHRPTSGYGMATRGDVQGRDCSDVHATYKAGIVPNNPSAFPPSLAVRCRKLGQRTTPWMEEVEPRLEQRSRSSCRNSGRGAVVGAVAGVEPRRATCKAGIVPNNPSAFPPSLAVRCRKLGQRTTPWMEEVEPRQEQRSRSSCRNSGQGVIAGAKNQTKTCTA